MTKPYKNQQELQKSPKKHNLNKASPHDKFFKGWYSEPAFARELLKLALHKKEQKDYNLSKLRYEKNTPNIIHFKIYSLLNKKLSGRKHACRLTPMDGPWRARPRMAVLQSVDFCS